ncbi:MAG TPA: carboxypeptidase regulatory-like domain-containing protein [Longimicrobiales bacterium]|nr:carboxypeptidase regulatory-like domain-containing protein [Longimicrobiales bacterium]
MASLVLAAFAAVPAAAVQDATGALAGRVLDADGRGMTGATVLVASDALLADLAASTDARGAYRVAFLPVGIYRVEVRALGYRGVVYEGVRVGLGATTGLPPSVLAPAPVAMEPLRVDARRPAIDPTSTAIAAELSAAELERLPAGRDFASFLSLLPLANESFYDDPVNVAGATGLENAYYIDGVNVTDLYRGRAFTSLPFDVVEAVQVVQGGYAAEYGHALGGIINVVTRSASSSAGASAFAYWSGDGVAASARPEPGVAARTDAADYDVGFSVGGPLLAGRLAAFAAYNPTFSRADVGLAGLGVEEETATHHVFATRLDWRAGRAWDVALSVFGDPSTGRVVSPPSGTVRLLNPDPILSRHRDGGVNASLHATWRGGGDLLLRGSLSRHSGREDVEGATELGRSEPASIDRTGAPQIVLSGGNATDQRIRSARTGVRVSAETRLGAHVLKGGLEYQDNRLDVRIEENPGQIIRTAADRWEVTFFRQDVTVRNRVATAYVQDSWTPVRQVTVNAGLRWDGQYLIDQGGGVGQRLTDQIQPRVGVVYRPDAGARHKLFAHAGRFYQQLPLYWSTLALAGFDQRQEVFLSDPLAGGAPDSVTVFATPDEIRGGVDGLRGEHHDELVAGWEAAVGDRTGVALRGVRRVLRRSVTSAFRPDGAFTGGNPGFGPLDHLPRSTRTFEALEASVRHRGARHALLASYVLSRNEGNYPGLLAADAGGLRGGSFGPNNDMLTYFPAQAENADGPLPNDRPHVFKLLGSVDAWGGLGFGTTLVVASGTPLSEFGRVPGGFNTPLFLAPRGSEGRTPALWDLSFRVRYDWSGAGGAAGSGVVGGAGGSGVAGGAGGAGGAAGWIPAGRVVLDLLHVGNPQSAVRVDQRRFNAARGSPFATYEQIVANQVGEREAFGAEIGYQPPFTVRLGVEVGVGRALARSP